MRRGQKTNGNEITNTSTNIGGYFDDNPLPSEASSFEEGRVFSNTFVRGLDDQLDQITAGQD